jgi:hypothetical protein
LLGGRRMTPLNPFNHALEKARRKELSNESKSRCWEELSPCALGGNQRLHLSISGFDGRDQRVGVSGDIYERVPHFDWFAFHVLRVIIHKYIAFPVRGAAAFAT